MSNKVKLMLLALLSIALLIVSGVGIFYLSEDSNTNTDALDISQERIDITVNVVDGNELKQYETNAFEGQTAFDLLKALDSQSDDFTFEYEEYDFGPYVVSVNSLKPQNNEFIEFLVNNEQASVGIGDYVLSKDDVITFKLTKIESFSF